MVFKNFILMLAFSVTQNLMAMDWVKLPSKEIIQKRLTELGFSTYAEEMQIGIMLGDQTQTTLGVICAVDFTISQYKRRGSDSHAADLHLYRQAIVKIILRDYPDKVEEVTAYFDHSFLSKKK